VVRRVCATAALAALIAMSFLLGGCYNRAQRLYQRAEAFLAEGNSTLAAQEYRRLVIEDPRSPLADDALYKLGYLFREDFGDAAGAISIYQMLADQHPDSPYAPLSLLWMAYIQRRDLEDAAGVRASLEMLGNRYPDQQRTIARCQLELVRALYIHRQVRGGDG
jgi:TolA-binding protein